jgi:hypothetical protein
VPFIALQEIEELGAVLGGLLDGERTYPCAR